MPTQTLIPHVESPDGIGHDILNHSSATMPGSGSSMTPHISLAEKTDVQAACCPTLSCMFCEETFQHEEELGPHLLSRHPTTLHAPAVLRVEAEFLAPCEKSCPKAEPEEELSCDVCGQATEDAAELEAHMRKHKDSFTYCCGLCGRRFKEPWFLKNHMRTHGKTTSKNKNHDSEEPITINDVVQEQPAFPVATAYKMCMVCGFFFLNKEALAEHSKVHSREPEVEANSVGEDTASKDCFLNYLKLQPALGANSRQQDVLPGRWIPHLDPFTTYQAWQLATKGKIAVGPNLSKELNAESNTDNEESGSDKEELGSIWDSSGGDKAVKRGFRGDLKPKIIGGETQTPLSDQKSLMRKDKPTACEECGKTFRTYHQLVLHSRIHKKDRGEAESPTMAAHGRTTSVSSAGSPVPDRPDDASEDGSEEGVAVETYHSDKAENGLGKMKLKILAPRKCCYCGKTFRSNYYLNIHLRTHTGEKPYKCEHCDYAAAQKTSLRYHLDRRHKDKPFTEIPNVPVTAPTASVTKIQELPRNTNDKQVSKSAKPFPAPSPVSVVVKSEPATNQPAVTPTVGPAGHVKEECGNMSATAPYTPPIKASHIKCPLPLNLKVEDKEASEAPLNLSLKAALSISATSVPRNMLLTNACTSCPYETLYPEVLLMHSKLIHKDKTDIRKNGYRPPLKLKRYTGCPPALEGKDVAPLPHINRKHPRRTKSPPPQPPRTGDKIQTPKPPQMLKVSPTKEPWRDHQHVTQRSRTAEASAGAQHPRFSEPAPLPEPSRKFTSLADRETSALKPGPARNSAIWTSDAARLCLSDRFRSLTQMDFGGPASKRQKQLEPQQGATGIGDEIHRLVPSGRNVKGLMQGNLPLAPVRVAPSTSVGSSGGVEPDWNMINLLRSYTPGELAALYQPSVPSSSHAAGSLPAGSLPGSKPLVFPHYSASVSQRRSHPGAMPSNRPAPPDTTS